MVTRDDLKLLVQEIPGVTEKAPGSYSFSYKGRIMIWPYPERVHPKKARVPRSDQFCMRVADEDDKQALLVGEPEVFFTTDHYNGHHSVIVRLDAVDPDRLQELVDVAVEATPLRSTTPK